MTLLLFDVDGTLTEPMKPIDQSVIDYLGLLKSNGYRLAVVGGSDYSKIYYQLNSCWDLFDYICTENGLVTYHGKEIISNNKFRSFNVTCVYELLKTSLIINNHSNLSSEN